MVKKFILEGMDALEPSAASECRRLWDMRETLPCVNDVTFPILCQYCGVWAKVNDITNSIIHKKGEELENAIDQLQKLQKIMLSYATVLKLNEKPTPTKSKNKFASLLLNQ